MYQTCFLFLFVESVFWICFGLWIKLLPEMDFLVKIKSKQGITMVVIFIC